jgi:crossover junction endodeoxyribonuclease RuvC
MKHRLVVEVDGGQHNCDVHHERDRQRDAKLAREGFRVLRFWNNDVDENLPGVLELIDEALNRTPPTRPPAAATVPLRGRD